MKYACNGALAAFFVSLFCGSAIAQSDVQRIYLESQFVEIVQSNLSDIGFEGQFAELSQYVTVDSDMGMIFAIQGAQYLTRSAVLT